MSKAIDEDLYSRQIGTFGMEAMGKLIQMKVLISGLRGVGVETAKNLILAGPARVVLHDDALVEVRDLGSNFYCSEADVGKRSRAQACVQQLSRLNDYVSVDVHSGPLTREVISQFNVIVVSEATRKQLIEYNDACRACEPQIGFISADTFGLACSIFVDFGDNFTCRDKDGEEPRSAILTGITKENPAMVHTHTERRHGFQDGDYVSFDEVQGMVELNSCKPKKIKVVGPYAFTIEEDCTGYTAYEREGIVRQVKVPMTVKFKSFSSCQVQPIPEGGDGCLPVPDLAKFGRSEQLHIAIQAIREYQERHGALPVIRDSAASEECVKIAKEINEARKKEGAEKAVFVEEVEEDVVKKVAFFARCCICPMAAYVGGIVAQEVVKLTGKYHPLHQVLYADMFELLPGGKLDQGNCAPLGARYDDQVVIFGQEFQKQLGDMRLFLVGAGALGCEFMKSFAMIGAGCGSGKVTLTDMDRIETSNLNRQFLFRKEHIGKPKSSTAAEAAQVMNSSLKVQVMEDRVGPDTEDIFDDKFWEDQTCIVNALDNIQARMYVDSRCVWFEKPLLESGTLGTKGNVQVVLPHLTQSYGDSQDPPEESIPLCTLKHFPHAIEHTIEWSRDYFQGAFVDTPQEVNNFLKDHGAFLAKCPTEGTSSSQVIKLKSMRKMLDRRKTGFEPCVDFAVMEFQDKFHDQICQLLHTFPLDHQTSEGTPFWSGPKRPPQGIRFDPKDKLHLDFVIAAANIYAYNLGIPPCRDRAAIEKMASNVSIPEFRPKEMKFKVDDKDTTREGAADDDQILQEYIKDMTQLGVSLKGSVELTPSEFEKDDDSNFHIDFMAASANLRARNYKIPEADRHKIKMIAGKIIPAIATTTAMVTGLVCAELMKICTRKDRKLEEFKNAFANLALPLWVLSEPLEPLKTKSKDYDPVIMGPVKARPEGFTSWDKVNINLGDATLKQFVNYLLKEVGVEVMILSCGNACLYNAYLPAHKKRLDMKVSKLYEDITKVPISGKKRFLTIEVSATDQDEGIDVQIPTIKFQFRQ